MLKCAIGIEEVLEGPFHYANDVMFASCRDLRQEQHSIASEGGNVRAPNLALSVNISSAMLPMYKIDMVRSWNERKLVTDFDDEVSRLPGITFSSP